MIGYSSTFMDRIIERANKRQERMEKIMFNYDADAELDEIDGGITNEEWIKEEKDTNQFACKMCELFEIRCTDCKFYDKSMRIGGCTLPSYLKEVHKE